MQLNPTDTVLVRLEVKGRADARPLELNEQVKVSALGIQARGAAQAPQFDAAAYARGIVSQNAAEREAAQRLHAQFLEAVATFQANQGVKTTPAETLATAVVDWVIATRPGGKTFSRDDRADGYVINEREINVARGEVGGEVFWRVTAVGTWGR